MEKLTTSQNRTDKKAKFNEKSKDGTTDDVVTMLCMFFLFCCCFCSKFSYIYLLLYTQTKHYKIVKASTDIPRINHCMVKRKSNDFRIIKILFA